MCNSGVLGPKFIPSKNKLDILTTFWDEKNESHHTDFLKRNAQSENLKLPALLYQFISIPQRYIRYSFQHIYRTHHYAIFPTNPKKISISLRQSLVAWATSLPKRLSNVRFENEWHKGSKNASDSSPMHDRLSTALACRVPQEVRIKG